MKDKTPQMDRWKPQEFVVTYLRHGWHGVEEIRTAPFSCNIIEPLHPQTLQFTEPAAFSCELTLDIFLQHTCDRLLYALPIFEEALPVEGAVLREMLESLRLADLWQGEMPPFADWLATLRGSEHALMQTSKGSENAPTAWERDAPRSARLAMRTARLEVLKGLNQLCTLRYFELHDTQTPELQAYNRRQSLEPMRQAREAAFLALQGKYIAHATVEQPGKRSRKISKLYAQRPRMGTSTSLSLVWEQKAQDDVRFDRSLLRRLLSQEPPEALLEGWKQEYEDVLF